MTVAMAVLLGTSAFAAKDTKDTMGGMGGEKVTIQGTLVDTKCYSMMQSNTGNDHQTPKGLMPSCGTACAAMGIPVGLLKDGKAGSEITVLLTPAPNLAPHMAQEARVTGLKVSGGSILPDKLEVKGKDGKWQEVNLVTMM